jgi:hypothetical protein
MPIDDYSNDAPDAPPNNASAPAPGKFIKISVPDFMNTGNASGMGSYLRLGAVEDLTKAGKAAGAVGLVVDVKGNPLTADLNAPFNPSYDPYAPFGPTNGPTNDTPVPPATTPLPAPPATSPANPSAAAPDPTGEDLASLVQGFADDTRNRGVWTGTPGGQPKDPGTTAQGPLYGYPWTQPVTDAKAPGQLDATPASPKPPLVFNGQSKPVFFPNDYRTLESSQLHTKGGWRDHSDGNRITTTRGDKVEVIRGNYKLIVLGRQDQSKPKYAGMDISGGTADTGGGDLTADASTDFNQGSTAFSTVVEWRQCETEANAKKQAQTLPTDVAALLAAYEAAQANAEAKELVAQSLSTASTKAATDAATAVKAAASTEDVAAVAASNAAAAAAETAAAAAAEAQTQATEAASAAALATQKATAAAAAATTAAAASTAADAQAQAAAEAAAANPTPQNQALATAASAAAATAASKSTAAAAASTAAAADAATKTAAVATTAAAAAMATAAAATAAATAATAATTAAATATPGTLQAAIQAQAVAAAAAAQAQNAATQSALAQAQANDARAKLIVVEAGLYATPLQLLDLWEDDGGDPDFRSFSTAKAGAGPKVQTKYQNLPEQTPDGVTFTQPISMGVSIAEKWSYQVYNYQGIGYYPATIPQPQPYPPPKTQTMVGNSTTVTPGTAIDAPSRNPPPPDFPTLPEWVIYPVSKVVNKTYVWRQSSETYVEQTVAVTAGPRLHPAVHNVEFPERTYPPDAFSERLYDRDLLKAVLMPGAQPGAYNKIDSTWAETHVNDSKTWTRANTTLNDTEVLGLQHTVNHINTSLTETTVEMQTTISTLGVTLSETTVGSQTTILTAGSTLSEQNIGLQTSALIVGVTTSASLTGEKTTYDVVDTNTGTTITGEKTTVTMTSLDLVMSLIDLHVGLAIGDKIDLQIGDTISINIGDSITGRQGDTYEFTKGKLSAATHHSLF